MITEDNKLTFDLYHGTSTLFLDSIIENGLGGINPVDEWNLLEIGKEVYTLGEEYLKNTKLFQVNSSSFKCMIEQRDVGSLNSPQGETYLSPSKKVAVTYAICKPYGSEILSYIIDFLKELIRLDIHYIKIDLSKKYKQIFELIELNSSPLLIQLSNLNAGSLLSECGEDPKDNLNQVKKFMSEDKKLFDLSAVKTNFRLTSPVKCESLKFWFINYRGWDYLTPQYNLYEINANRTEKEKLE